jgi:flagellar biosynthesis/type III secretory pathway ATPase
MSGVAGKEHLQLASKLRDVVATYRGARDLINIGAYVAGSNPQIDRAIQLMPAVTHLLRQMADERSTFEDTLGSLRAIFAGQSS